LYPESDNNFPDLPPKTSFSLMYSFLSLSKEQTNAKEPI
jgi:hypothetical protein